MIPPGLAFVSISERAWKAHAEARMPRFYWDFSKCRDFLQKDQTPFTPAVSLFFALDVSLKLMAKEGLQNIIKRHIGHGERARAGVKSLGLQLFADERYASNTVTAITSPDGIDGDKIRAIMRDEHDTVLAGGQSKLAGKIFRIGHLGWVTDEEIDDVFVQLRQALPKVGYKLPG